MAKVFYALAILHGLLGYLALFPTAVFGMLSAPQQAAIAAMIIGFTICPYVVARSIEGIMPAKRPVSPPA